jgi:hypothetical protein
MRDMFEWIGDNLIPIVIGCVLGVMMAVFVDISATSVSEETKQVKEADNINYTVLINNGSMFIYSFYDEETGVSYISTTGGITPRLNVDGSLYTQPE